MRFREHHPNQTHHEHTIHPKHPGAGRRPRHIQRIRRDHPWVGVGNAGNAPDSTGYGAVGYDYTVNPGSANKPITSISWFDAARFCNWLHKGQGNGSTETGAYTLSGAINWIVEKNTDAKYWIPTEDEWYKAAYYDPAKGGTGGYWPYPTQSDALGGNTIGGATPRIIGTGILPPIRVAHHGESPMWEPMERIRIASMAPTTKARMCGSGTLMLSARGAGCAGVPGPTMTDPWHLRSGSAASRRTGTTVSAFALPAASLNLIQARWP